MKFSSQQELYTHYKERYTVLSQYQVKEDFLPQSKLCIVIPCYNEPDLTITLNSLKRAEQPEAPVEVIIVINSPSNASERVIAQNSKSLKDFINWNNTLRDSKILAQTILAIDLPEKKAGVGLARKIGMDEAFRQFAKQNRVGHIICLDADCTVSKSYLVEAENQLTEQVRGGHFYFEHIITNVYNPGLRKGITEYELHLRYHNQGLKYTGFPFADHTVGSCMIVRSDVYALLGGMNQRKAGEDFYFMNKVYAGGNCIEIKNATVFPSARISDRVPFGTGKAQGDWIDEQKTHFETYNPRIYEVLKKFLDTITNYKPVTIKELPESIKPFLVETNFIHHHSSILNRSSSNESFQKNLFLWCDAFYLLKMIHFLRDNSFPNKPVIAAAKQLLNDLKVEFSADATSLDLLEIYRQLEQPEPVSDANND